jgi:hypothetical protein
METPHTPDPDYQRGFNEGYLITEHLPDLAHAVSRIANQIPRLDGFRDGQKQFILEQTKDQLPWMKCDQKTATKDQSKDKGIDKEPER